MQFPVPNYPSVYQPPDLSGYMQSGRMFQAPHLRANSPDSFNLPSPKN